jgi:uncharacterized heparinase superfamily protein
MLRMLRHVPPGQILARAGLQMQRRIEQRWPPELRARDPIEVSTAPPRPIFAPRTGRVDLDSSSATFRFVGIEESFRRPIDWRPRKHQHGTRLWLLNLHYMEYLEELDTPSFLALIEEWIALNPPFAPEFWKDNWNSFALSIRVVVWMQQLAARGLTGDAPASILSSLHAQLSFLERHIEADIGGNHIVKNIKALLWGGRFFEGSAAGRWFAAGRTFLERELKAQILADGVHYELTPAYHRQVFADLLEIRSVLPEGSLRDRVDSVLRRMADALVRFVHPDGDLAQFGDTALHSDHPPRELLRALSEFSGWTSPAAGPWNLPVSGFAGYSSDEHYFIARGGPIAADELPAHAHGDAGSFEWSVGGVRMIVDTGVFEYNEGPRRAWSRSTEAHNTVSVGGLDQAEFWGAFRMGRRPRVERSVSIEGSSLTLTISHDGYTAMAGNPRHRRTFHFSPSQLEVSDEVTGGGNHEVVAHLTVHPEVVVDAHGHGWTLVRGHNRLLLETKAEVSVREVDYFPEFGVSLKTRQLLLRYGTVPAAGSFRLLPRSD